MQLMLKLFSILSQKKKKKKNKLLNDLNMVTSVLTTILDSKSRPTL